MRDLSEIVQDKNGYLSSSKVAYMLVVITLCFVVISMEIRGHTDATVLGIFAMMGAGVYGMNKTGETLSDIKAPQPPQEKVTP